MDNIWSILQIKETSNVAEIKKAYAQLARKYHPEEEPEKFLRLRKAYQAALDYAENAKENDFEDEEEAFGEPGKETETVQVSGEETWKEPGKDIETTKMFWDMEEDEPEANPYADSEVHKEFLDIYCSGKRKNKDCWTKFFISPAFLEVCRKKEFTALMLETVTEMEKEYPLNKEFLTALYVAYQFTCEEVVSPYDPVENERKFQLYEGAAFDGIGFIFEIAGKGPVQRKFSWNEHALRTAYLEYWRLVYLADNSGWHDKALEELRQITGGYAILNIQDKCRDSYDRSVHGVKVISHFFERRDLPEEVFQVVWKSLDLKSAILGRGKVLYGRIREIALERFPDLPNKEESFRELLKYMSEHTYRINASEETIKEETDALFAREDFQRAFWNHEMVKEYVIKFWISKHKGNYFLERILEFYKKSPDAPFADEAVAKIRYILKQRNVETSLAEDSAARAPQLEDVLTMSYRPFFRYWLNVNFYSARNYEGGNLRDYMNENFPYSYEWSRRFLDFHEENKEPAASRSVSLFMGENKIEILFHLYYAEFVFNGSLMCAPFVPWEVMSRTEQDDMFFLLLPVALARYSSYGTVAEEITKRITKLGFLPEEDAAVIADYISSSVCQLPDSGMPEEDHAFVLPMEIYRETPERLFGCEWHANEQALWVFEQTRENRNYFPDSQYDFIFDMKSFIGLSRKLLESIVNPVVIDFEQMERMPDVVYFAPGLGAMPMIGEEVTADRLSELLGWFAEGRLARLEFAWNSMHSLVFLHDYKKYTCICFDDETHCCHELISLPELYAARDELEVWYAPFKRGKLPDYCIHNSFATIEFHLNTIFSQIGKEDGIQASVNDEWIWTTNVMEENSYNIMKQLVGDFPVERATIAFSKPFQFNDMQMPSGFETIDLEKNQQTVHREEVTAEAVQDALALCMQGKLKKLRLTWSDRHIAIMQDSGRYLMAVLDDSKKCAEYYVADIGVYINVEGRKYPKDTFNDKTMPAYLIHNDLFKIHNCLHLLLDNIADFSPITMAFGEFARENPVKNRAYEEILGDFV